MLIVNSQFMAFLFLVLVLLPNPSTASDFISLNQSISGDQKLISKNGDFELGLFKPGNSSYYYIGIWYSLNKVPQLTSVWVANRETPLSDSSKTEIKISKSGNLVIANSSNPSVWSTNVTNISSTTTTVAILLDSGNLVLMNGNLTMWQSFDHPTHTYLPGAKLGLNKITKELQRLTSWKSEDDPAPGIFSLTIDPNGSSQYFIYWNNSFNYWSSGYWNGDTFSLVPEMTRNYVFDFYFVSSDREAYFTYSLKPDYPILSRLIIDTSGQIKQLTWVENIKQWVLFWSQPRKQCAVQALCGPFGSCNENALPYCNCIKGFTEKSPSDWAMGDRTQGCSRNNQLQCGFNSSRNVENDKFFPMSNMKFPDNPKKLYIKAASDCEQYCLNDCSCTAYCITNNSTCLFWVGDLVNLQNQYDSGMSDGGTIFLRLAASEISDPKSNNLLHKTKTVIGVSTAAGIVLLLACVGCFSWRTKNRNMKKRMRNATPGFSEHSNNADREDIVDLPLFEVSTIVNATNYFSAANKLGVGGFGPVYKGILGPNQEIAVKRLSKTSMQGVEEFKNEVMLIAKLQHRNLVRLLGYCIHREERMLIYEYMPNKSLDAFLFEKKGALLDWNIRYQIILGVTRGLLYLHHDSRLRIIHRDLKASNILLDKNMKPKISDFGLARIFIGDETTDLNTAKVVGTYGYMSPEYAMEGIFSMKSDVFSFGVLILEIVSGRKNRGEYIHSAYLNLVAHAWSLWNEGNSLHLVDETLSNSYSEEEALKCIKVGLLCVQERARDRPLISSIMEFLASASDIASIPMPKRPGFLTRTGPTETNSNLEIHEECTSNNITESFEGR